MPKQSARLLVLICVVMGLVGSPRLVSGYVAGDREILEHIAVQTHHDERLEDTEVHIVVQGGQVVLSGTVYLYSQKCCMSTSSGGRQEWSRSTTPFVWSRVYRSRTQRLQDISIL